MIWVIGDIHGMFDPLKRLISILHSRHKNDERWRIDKLIFMGDYIDFGPSSKEVIDYIMDLPFETVCLMGNHEDLFLQFFNHDDLIQEFGNVWFRGNGGQRTIQSFFPEISYHDREDDVTISDIPSFQDKYINFFKNLKVTHIEQIGNHKIAFVHALLNNEYPIDEQLSIKTYDDFHKWRRENSIWIEDTILWNRAEPVDRFDDYILIHGHIPTSKINHGWRDIHGYDISLQLPFLKFKSDDKNKVFFDYQSYRKTYNASIDKLIAINVDTGSVYGHRLSAIGISEELLEESEIPICQILTTKGYRLSDNINIDEIYFY